jgi:type I restriction enzyme S subunit
MKLLEHHFDTAFDAPDGIKKLRELILTLAMQGKLVPQDPKSQPASGLLKEIGAEKKRLVKQGKIKEPKPIPPVSAEEMPYGLPKGWEWVRLGAVAEYNGRDNADPKDIDKDCWVLDLEDIEKTTSRLLYRAKYSERESKSTKSQFKAGDVLYGKLRPYLDKVIVANGDGVCTTEIVPIVPSKAIVAHFLRWMLKSPSFLRYVNGLMYGVKMPRLGTDDAINSIHPLPPLYEQLRIVAKIDELMARCDALEKLRAERDAQRLAVHSTAVRQLLNVADTDTHIQARDFLGLHFGELYTVKENVTELRKAILQLAVMGKLAPQDSNDPPASVLLKQIEAEKKRLVKAGKIKEPKTMEPVLNEEMPFQIPESWNWVRLGDLGNSQTGTTPPSNNQSYYGDHIPFIGPGDIKDGSIDYSGKGLSRSGMSIARVIDADSLLMVCIGGSIGKHAINTQIVTCNQQINTLTPYKPLPIRFLYWFASAPCFQSAVLNASGGSATPIINKQKWSSIVTPLPPLAEQHRIFVKIDQLMSMCDILEQQIDAARETQSALLNAMMAQYGGQRCA